MSSVFHYTDAGGLLGILSTQSLFATDYRYLNDSTEGREVRNLILPIFEKDVAELTQRLVEKNWLEKEFYDEYGRRGHQLQAENIYTSISQAADNISPFFVLSFCRHDEDSEFFRHGLLSQWRGYAESGGFAVEFDEAKLDILLKSEMREFEYVITKSDDVLYKDFDKLFNSEVYKGIAGGLIYKLFESRGVDVSEVTGKKQVTDIVFDYVKVAPFLKHISFSEEREYRIVAACNRPLKIIPDIMKPAKEIKFRTRNNLIVPYIELFKSIEEQLPIKSIIVGPHPYQQRQAEAVSMALEVAKIRVPIRLSAVPFRR
jgi:hypothetical protein